MANAANSTTLNADALVDLTQKLKALDASDDIIATIIDHTIDAKRRIAGELADQFYQRPITMALFADELATHTRRLQGLGVAMLGLDLEHKDDGYVDGIHQMVLDLECNAHRLEETFNILRDKSSS